MQTVATFDTSNFYLAVYLMAHEIALITIERAGGTKASFIFADSDQRKSLADQFHFGEPQADVRRFVAAIRQLKSGLYDGVT